MTGYPDGPCTQMVLGARIKGALGDIDPLDKVPSKGLRRVPFKGNYLGRIYFRLEMVPV